MTVTKHLSSTINELKGQSKDYNIKILLKLLQVMFLKRGGGGSVGLKAFISTNRKKLTEQRLAGAYQPSSGLNRALAMALQKPGKLVSHCSSAGASVQMPLDIRKST